MSSLMEVLQIIHLSGLVSGFGTGFEYANKNRNMSTLQKRIRSASLYFWALTLRV